MCENIEAMQSQDNLETPDYLYNAEKCPCVRGARINCPRYRDCEACVAFHHSGSDLPLTPKTACELIWEKEKKSKLK